VRYNEKRLIKERKKNLLELNARALKIKELKRTTLLVLKIKLKKRGALCYELIKEKAKSNY